MATKKTDPLWLRQASALERVAKDNLFLAKTLMGFYRADVLNVKAREAIKNHCALLREQAYHLITKATELRGSIPDNVLLEVQAQPEDT